MKVLVRKAFVAFDGRKQIIGKAGQYVDVSPELIRRLKGFIELNEVNEKDAMLEPEVKKAARTRKKKNED